MLIKPKKTLKYHLLFKIRINPLHINIVSVKNILSKRKQKKMKIGIDLDFSNPFNVWLKWIELDRK